VNSLSFSSGATTDTSTVIDPASGVKSSPSSGVKVHTPQLGHSVISQSSFENDSPTFSTVKLSVTVSPGFTLVQLILPSHFNSDILDISPLMQKFAVPFQSRSSKS